MAVRTPAAAFLAGAALLCGCSGSSQPPARAETLADNRASVGAPQCDPEECARIGGFTPPFVEPLIPAGGDAPPDSPANPANERPGDDRCRYDENGLPLKCKPAAGTLSILGDGRALYFNALEGTERVEFSVFFEAGHAIQNDQTRVLTLTDIASWDIPSPVDGGANPDGQEPDTILPPGTIDNQEGSDNDGALFCADVAHLADGRVLAVGGTDYYNEPGVQDPFPVGVSELEGLRNARIFDPGDNTWSKTGDMNWGRWYPSVVNLDNGDVFVASGVTKLLKPLYPDRPMQSGRNVVETETYDLCAGTWSDNGALAQRSLPLYPRLHLLPNGHVLYAGAGQAFNPFGQSYDQALWNMVAAYDPGSKTWSDVGIAGLPVPPPADPLEAALLTAGGGFRGSTFSIMLPLRPDESGNYPRVELLTAGGVLGGVLFTNPGSNQPVAFSRIDTVTVGAGGVESYTSRTTGDLNAARWYGTGVLLPTGEVMVFSGADRDEVQGPGTGVPIVQTERFDPATETWSPMAVQGNPRTYHNTAALLPDGRVLVGGHAPINTLYAYSLTLPGFSPNDGRDPTFEIYSPPYVFGPRPVIAGAPGALQHGQEFTITSPQAQAVESVVLVRVTDITHLIDGDQRSVLLPVVSRSGDSLTVRMPAQKAVAPAGKYLLFINAPGPNGLTPSVSAPVTVINADRDC